ncbi:MAG TPA: hypothetical protein VD886_26715 [Herpetosiphonaceae bacterium]|nr:hypothetical protein [Herpetosiphonaceae bacterium]
MNERGCYCRATGPHPEHLQRQGVPEGFCGMCELCGQPGHARHFPGAVPYTGAWCDPCYKKVGNRYLLRWFVIRLVIGLIIAGVILLIWRLE